MSIVLGKRSDLKVLKDCELPVGFSENVTVKFEAGDVIEHNGEFCWRIKGRSSLFPHIPVKVFNKAIEAGFLQEV